MESPKVSAHLSFQQDVDLAYAQFCKQKQVVFSGPSGTGKSTLAACFSKLAWGQTAPFISQHASGLDRHRFESQIFGHMKGAFTGASLSYPGLAGLADEGSLCIEDIGSLGSEEQARLLRFIQERNYRRIGDIHDRDYRGALIFTSRQSLTVLLNDGLLREDLFYRIHANELKVWPISERPLDQEHLFTQLVDQVKTELGMPDRLFSATDRASAFSRALPGNLHSLRNLILQSYIRDCPIQAVKEDPFTPQSPGLPDSGDLKSDLAQCEKQLISRALKTWPDSREQLAKQLGISRRSLMYKLKTYQLSERAQQDT